MLNNNNNTKVVVVVIIVIMMMIIIHLRIRSRACTLFPVERREVERNLRATCGGILSRIREFIPMNLREKSLKKINSRG